MLGWLSIQPILGRSPGSPLPAIPSSLIILNEKVYVVGNVNIGSLSLPSIHSLFLEWWRPSLFFGSITPPPLLSVPAAEMGGADHILSSCVDH